MRFNVHFARQILAEQPAAAPGRLEPDGLPPARGLRLAITPFNFTAIAGNLPTAPALHGQHGGVEAVADPAARRRTTRCGCWRRPGCRPGVINLVTGDGTAVSEVALPHRDLAGIHFTGSTATFQHLWRTVGEQHRASTASYPRLVGETGGKDFVVAHPSADPATLRDRADPRRVRVPGPEVLGGLPGLRAALALGRRLRDELAAEVERLTMGDVTDLSQLLRRGHRRRAFAEHKAAIDRRASRPDLRDRSPAARPTTARATSSARPSS